MELPSTIKKGKVVIKSSIIDSIQESLGYAGKLAKKSIHGADAAFCSRKSALHFHWDPDIKEPIGPASEFYFKVGNATHSVVYSGLKRAGILLVDELRVTFQEISGYVDAIVLDPSSGRLKILDVKTCGKLPTRIKPGQAEQLMTYVLLTGIEEASILYVSRSVATYDGKLLMREIPLEITPSLLEQGAYMLAQSIAGVKRHVIPPKPAARTSYSNCGWCPFKDAGCWSVDNGHWPEFLDQKTFPEVWDYETMIVGAQDEFDSIVQEYAGKLLEAQPKFRAKTLRAMLSTTPAQHKDYIEAELRALRPAKEEE